MVSRDALFVHPAEGTHPAVLIWPDILALRPSFRAMATRLAKAVMPCCASIPTTEMRDPGRDGRKLRTMRRADFHSIRASPQTHVRCACLCRLIPNLLSIKSPHRNYGLCMGGPMVMRAGAERADRTGARVLITRYRWQLREDSRIYSFQDQCNSLIALAENDDEQHLMIKTYCGRLFPPMSCRLKSRL